MHTLHPHPPWILFNRKGVDSYADLRWGRCLHSGGCVIALTTLIEPRLVFPDLKPSRQGTPGSRRLPHQPARCRDEFFGRALMLICHTTVPLMRPPQEAQDFTIPA